MPAERPPLVGEVVPTYLRIEGVAWSAQRIPTVTNLGFLDRSRYFFFQVALQLSSRGWVDPVPDPLLLRKSGNAGNRTQDLGICSHKLWPLDHRRGHTRTLTVDLSVLYILHVNGLVWVFVFHYCWNNIRSACKIILIKPFVEDSDIYRVYFRHQATYSQWKYNVLRMEDNEFYRKF
jgi:hypothetical protein